MSKFFLQLRLKIWTQWNKRTNKTVFVNTRPRFAENIDNALWLIDWLADWLIDLVAPLQVISWSQLTVSLALYTTRSTSTRNIFASSSSTHMPSWSAEPTAEWYSMWSIHHLIRPVIWHSRIRWRTREAACKCRLLFITSQRRRLCLRYSSF